jgi:uncharacterized Tic20 family protein
MFKYSLILIFLVIFIIGISILFLYMIDFSITITLIVLFFDISIANYIAGVIATTYYFNHKNDE